MTLTDKLDLLLKEKGLNRKEFSRQSGIPYMTIVNFYEKGTENVKLSTLKKIANFFDVSLDYIADDSVSEKSPYQKDLFAGAPTDDTEKLIHKTFQTMDVKTKLSELLEEKGMKQADLSRITGIPTSLISNYLKGVKSPSLSNAVVLASALNVTVDDLAGLSSDETPSIKGKGLIGNRIAELRKEKGFSRVQFAQQIGIPFTTLRNYETGVREPGHSFIVQMAKEFNVSTDYLLGLTDNRIPDEIKKSPEPAANDSEDEKDVIVKILTEGLSRLGFLDGEGMISDRDFKFLCTLVDLISDHFEKD